MRGWLHRVLGVERNADPMVVRKAYADLVRVYHPDRCPDSPSNRRRLGLLAAARAVLSDPALRLFHMQTGLLPPKLDPEAELGLQVAGASVKALARGFVQAMQRQRPRDGQDQTVSIRLSPEELVRGASREVGVSRVEPCDSCRGSGADSDWEPLPCHICDATGTLTLGRVLSRGMACPFCEGLGLVIRVPCPECSGNGFHKVERPCALEIPAGVPEGHRVVLRGEGERGLRGGRHGDLVFVLRMDPSSGLARDGADLVLNVDVPGEASAITVPHPDGGVRLTLPETLDTTCTVVAEGLGLPRFEEPSKRGDLRVHVRRKGMDIVE